MVDAPPLHPMLEPLAFLLGSWKGKGAGRYPTIDDFSYLEVSTFTHVGKPFVSYTQRTRDAVTGEPLHAETGYLRPLDDEHGEFILAQPSGILEVHDVVIREGSIEMMSTNVIRTPTAKQVDAVVRHISVAGTEMHYSLDMAAVGQDLQMHLEAVLTRD